MDEKFSALSDLVDLLCQVANTVVSAPKPLTLTSLALLFPLMSEIEKVAKESGDLVPELKALDLAEGQALIDQIAGSLAVGNQKVKDEIAAGLKVIAAISDLMKAINE